MPLDGQPYPRQSRALKVEPVLRTGCWAHAMEKPVRKTGSYPTHIPPTFTS